MESHGFFALFISSACLSACAQGLILPPATAGGPAIHGRVVEEGSGRPIEGAIVAVYWEGVVPLKGSHTCVHVETAVTARDGTYRTAAWTFPKPVIYTEPEMNYRAYKSGMILHRESLGGATLELIRFSGNREERLKELQRLSRNAACSNPSVGIADLKEAIATEMAELVTSRDETRIYVEEARELSRSEREGAATYARWLSEQGVGR